MAINAGDRLPSIKLQAMVNGRIKKISTNELFKNKKAILFAVPAAFSPSCSEQHLPGYVSKAFEFRKKGIEQLYCISVNDIFVMNAWARDQDIVDEVTMLADGNAEFTRAIGLGFDMSKFGLGLRSSRYAMLIDDCIVKKLFLEKGGEVKLSSAENMLDELTE